jgi:phosphatidylserine/phosphatidylglycerophosphate/cardiolipin synthase-like enzyme
MKTPSKSLVFVFLIGTFAGFFASASLNQNNKPADLTANQAVPVNDREYFSTMKALIDMANDSVHVSMFEIKWYPDYPDSSMNEILDALIRAKKRGIDVRIVTDEYLTDKPVLTYLEQNGLDIRYDSEETTTHSKLVIIDKKLVMVGSTNWSFYALEKNNEANVLIYSEDLAQQYEEYFRQVWA